MGLFKGNGFKLIGGIQNTINNALQMNNERRINRDNLQAGVMLSTGKDTQASRFEHLSNFTHDFTNMSSNMSGDASNMMVGMYGGGMAKKDGASAVWGKGTGTTDGGSKSTMKIIIIALVAFLAAKWFKLF